MVRWARAHRAGEALAGALPVFPWLLLMRRVQLQRARCVGALGTDTPCDSGAGRRSPGLSAGAAVEGGAVGRAGSAARTAARSGAASRSRSTGHNIPVLVDGPADSISLVVLWARAAFVGSSDMGLGAGAAVEGGAVGRTGSAARAAARSRVAPRSVRSFGHNRPVLVDGPADSSPLVASWARAAWVGASDAGLGASAAVMDCAGGLGPIVLRAYAERGTSVTRQSTWSTNPLFSTLQHRKVRNLLLSTLQHREEYHIMWSTLQHSSPQRMERAWRGKERYAAGRQTRVWWWLRPRLWHPAAIGATGCRRSGLRSWRATTRALWTRACVASGSPRSDDLVLSAQAEELMDIVSDLNETFSRVHADVRDGAATVGHADPGPGAAGVRGDRAAVSQ
jgi:hypothetical protein